VKIRISICGKEIMNMSVNIFKKKIAEYFRENAAIIVSSIAALNGDSSANRIYCLLKKQA